MNWIYRREARTLLSYERHVAAMMDASVFVSNSEAELFKQLAPEAAARVWDIHNGVDVDYFDPTQEYPVPYAASEMAIVFTGAMDYWANVDAVTWFAREVFPAVRQRHATAHFYIVGARPSNAVQQLSQAPGITVTGTVKDIRPYLAHARVAVAPLRIARGVQNKVLEAMAMARPVVVTPQALDGIRCQADREVVVAEGAAAFTDRVCAILRGTAQSVADEARRRVVSDYSWESNLKRFEALLEGESPGYSVPNCNTAVKSLSENMGSTAPESRGAG
jgi:sugar transferase (PEP-CTERM/EpsH1 system associated)